MSTKTQPQLKLINEWKQFVKSFADAWVFDAQCNELKSKIDMLNTEINRLGAQSTNLREKGNSMRVPSGEITAEGYRLIYQAIILEQEIDNLRSDRNRLSADRDKITSKAIRRRFEILIVWLDAVMEVYGKDVGVKWVHYPNGCHDCILSNGETYTAETSAEQ